MGLARRYRVHRVLFHPTGIIGNTSGIFVAPVMDQFGWTQTDTTMYRTIQPLVAAVCAPIAAS